MRIRSHLVLLVLAALLPLLAFATIIMGTFWWQQRTAFDDRFLERVRAMTVALDLEHEASIRALQSLARSPELDREDFAAFYDRARVFEETQPAWSTIALVRPSGEQVLNLRRPMGAQLPTLAGVDVIEAVVASRQPAVSGLVRSPITGEYGTRVAVPVLRQDSVRYVLRASIEGKVWLDFLLRNPVTSGATMTLLDQNGLVIARTLNPGRWTGQRASPELFERSRRSPEAAYRNQGLEGQWFYTAHRRSERTGWTLATGVPVESVETVLRGSTIALLAGALVTAVAVVVMALVFGRRIAGPVSALARSARALAAGTPAPAAAPGDVAEVAEVTRAFDEAAILLREREEALNHALTNEQRARADAEAANRAKDEFLAMLGHELRNPIGTISNAVAVLAHAPGTDPATVRIHELVRRQVHHLTDLVDDLLDVARVTSGRIVLSRRPLELGELVRRTVTMLGDAGRTGAHRIEIETREVWVSADETRIEQIATNLIENAAKYTSPGGRITVRVAPREGEAVLEVSDTGVGIAPELLPSIFDLFTQGERTLDRAQGGLGLGLTLVRRLAGLHQGSVEAVSEGPGRGATFTVRLPRIEAPAVTAPTAAAAGAPTSRRRILVIEDSDDGREMLKALLGLHGHEVHEASDGPSGVAQALAVRPDVAIVDIGLPGLDGYEVARRVRADAPASRIKLIALTGYGQHEDRQRTRNAGFDAHLVKPVDPVELARLLADP
jgi:signal transduction histidine kinase